MAAVGWITFGLGSMVGLTILRGLVLQALWGWFVVSAFSAPELSLVDALGISLIASFLTYQYDARKDDDDKSAKETVVASVVAGLFIYGFAYLMGALIHSFA